MDKNVLIKDTLNYNLTKELLSNVIKDLMDEIDENKNIIISANKIDIKYNKKQINIEDLKEIINLYTENKCINKDKFTKKMVIYRGDPLLTLHICMQALLEKNKILLIKDEFMLGINSIILKIFLEVLSRYGIDNLIDSVNSYSIKTIEEYEKEVESIIVIGDTTMYQLLENKNNLKYFPYNNIMLYCDDENLNKIQNAVFLYANENQYEIEILYEDTLEEAIEIINAEENFNIAILLVEKNINKENTSKKIKNKEVFINENPFKNKIPEINKYL